MATGRRKALSFVDGYSESAWKSLAVKSLRIGWPAGMQAAFDRLGRSTMGSLLVCGVFEDVFPSMCKLDYVMSLAKSFDFGGLCRVETHHGRGLTDEFCDMESEAVDAARTRREEIWAHAKGRKVWLPIRSLNCYYTWMRMSPSDGLVLRDADPTEWAGMPAVMLDGHTYEGKGMGSRTTILSGSYQQHRRIGDEVVRDGWGGIREAVHKSTLEPLSADDRSSSASLFSSGEEER